MVERLGSSRGLKDRRWSSMYEHSRQQVRSYMSVGSGLGWFQRVRSEGFPSVLLWFWRFLNVNELLWSVYEVFVKLPCMLGVYCRCCSAHLGGSGGLTEINIVDNKYGARQSFFERKSAVMRCLLISNQLTIKILRLEWDVSWVKIFGINLQVESSFEMDLAKIK